MAVHAKGTVVSIDNAAGSLQNISTHCNTYSLPQELDEVDVTTFGAAGDRAYITGFANATFSIGGPWHATIDGIMSGLFAGHKAGTISGGTTSFQVGPAGSASGAVRKSGECVMTSYEVNGDVGGAASWSAQFRITGGVTVDTYS